MERMTYWCEDGQNGGEWRVNIGGREESGTQIDRLAAYEETGLEPEEIHDQLESMVDAVALFFEISPNRLRELVRADKGGISPCTFCRFNPPSSGDGKPCCMCPADRSTGGDEEWLST